MRDEIEPTPLKAWKRGRPAEPVPEARPMRCGGPEYTRAERLELMRQKQREMDEAARRAREETEAREAAQRRDAKPADDEDGYPPPERRADRYAVGLLRQDDSAWGGAGAGPGTLG
ncbi:hypothetical protein [Polymorphospora sp. NPDC050346]|uniref:hypothetical protein n=1 Tax=Polymorphospora sp. NPDC050346 TaxID=3155780 RepID=UPI0033C0A44D